LKRIVLAVMIVCGIAAAWAQGEPAVPDLVDDFGEDSLALELGLALSFDGSLSTEEYGGITYFSPNFAMEALLSINNDGKYSPMHANVPGGTLGNNYFFIEGGGAAVTFGDFSLRAGRLPQHDVVDSPYSLFINGGSLAATTTALSFERGKFFFESRWLGLNHHSDTSTDAYPDGYPERGANLKVYGLKMGDMTFGLEDVAVYSGRYFDFDYFADPMPAYFIQYTNCLSGRPWDNGYEDNTIVGAFWRWDRPDGISAYAQYLMDDFNVFGLGGTPRNPWKMAWSLGGNYETPVGKFGFYHAGATKYCFEPTYETPSGREYGYTYYPDTMFDLDGTDVAIPFEDMMIGYQHGENNLAFMATWSDYLEGFDVGASFEFTLSGSKSPANAWHEATWTDYSGTKLLDEDVLEKRFLLTLGASRAFGNLVLFCQGELGYVFNELELVGIEPVIVSKPVTTGISYVEIWKPSDTNRMLYSITVGGRYRLGI
jgi:hypothetical protein